MTSTVEVYGVRHHGPGSARGVAAALDDLRPDAVVIEGPPELDVLVPLAASPDLRPPVAALAYAVDHPASAAFYPMASFSPEWVALRWAVDAGVPVRFADLPATHLLAGGDDDGTGTRSAGGAHAPGGTPGDAARAGSAPSGDAAGPAPAAVDLGPDVDAPDLGGPDVGAVDRGSEEADWGRPPALREDPVARLAAVAGYDDPERWWEDAVEHRRQGGGRPAREAFAHLGAALAELRRDEALPVQEQRREAAMRRTLRKVMTAHERVAVVCGAWHAPALDPARFPAKGADDAVLRGLPKVKVATTWIPWTADRLARRSGYGAGVDAPGWYDHLFTAGDDAVATWLTRVARCLRDEGLAAPPAGVIEAVRLAGSLAALRGRPHAGLDEVTDAARSVLCGGSPVPLAVVSERLVVGTAMGTVPEDTPMVPLARDLQATAKRLRLPRTGEPRRVEVDLRQAGGRERSTLFHRLRILGVTWAAPADEGRTTGTFKEAWSLTWGPEVELQLIEAARLGNTVRAAAVATLQEAADDAGLGALCALVERSLLADVDEAVGPLVAAVADRSAHQHDIGQLMEAVEPLARTCRYGDVRGRDVAHLAPVLDGIVARVCVGLPLAASALDDSATATLVGQVDAVARGLGLLDDPRLHDRWVGALDRLVEAPGVPGLVCGRATRLVFDAGRRSREEVAMLVARALSTVAAADAGRAAAWLDGFLDRDATLLLHDPDLLATVDDWVASVGPDRFDEVLPILRRTFSRAPHGERRMLGEHLRRREAGLAPAAAPCPVDEARADLVLPRVLDLLGVAR